MRHTCRPDPGRYCEACWRQREALAVRFMALVVSALAVAGAIAWLLR